MYWKLILLLSAIIIICARAQKAFPSAEGAGAYTVGGRNGKVYKVTHLRDTNELGSLRSAISAKGPRIVIFTVSGTIQLTSDLKINNPYITIAGQTAPGDGITLGGYSLIVQASEVIVRYIRVRPGDINKVPLDAITVTGDSTSNVIIDHVSATWAIDETITVTGVKGQVTVQWCIIGSSLHNSVHPKGNHGYGSLIRGGTGTTYHHNLYNDNRSRNPRAQQGLIEFSNNVMYNWDNNCGYTADIDPTIQLNYRNNYAKPGPDTLKGRNYMFLGEATLQIYTTGNYMETSDQTYANSQYLVNKGCRVVNTPFTIPGPGITLQSASSAYQSVLADVGCTVPFRDSVDTNIVNSVKTNTGNQIDSQNQVGGFPKLNSKKPLLDSDGDGMPDSWENSNGLNPKVDDSKNVANGYTAIERCINDINFWKKSRTSSATEDESSEIETEQENSLSGTRAALYGVIVVVVVVVVIVVVVVVRKNATNKSELP